MWIRGKLLFILEAKVRKIAPELAVDHVDEGLQIELENHAREVGVAHRLEYLFERSEKPSFHTCRLCAAPYILDSDIDLLSLKPVSESGYPFHSKSLDSLILAPILSRKQYAFRAESLSPVRPYSRKLRQKTYLVVLTLWQPTPTKSQH